MRNREEGILRPGGLVLYRKRPARVARLGDKLHIELEGGNLAKVRPKDVTPLHPGPLESLSDLTPQQGEVILAWEILNESRGPHDLAELAELVYGEYTPITAWAAWELVEDGLYFHGIPEAVVACMPEEVEQEQLARQEREAEARAWADFLERAQTGRVNPEADSHYLREVEDLALGRRKGSRLLRELGRSERPENAHTLLLNCGYWDRSVIPYPRRLKLSITPPEIELPPLPEEERVDLTNLQAFAIDDRDNKDPDDAISLASCQTDSEGGFLGGRIWVHIADAAALVLVNSPADLEARARGATVYLPEGTVPMLPPQAVERLGLGLQEVSPALSFSLELNARGEIEGVQIQPSWVRVKRLSYEEAEKRLEEPPLRELHLLAQAYQARRKANGALFIDLPEAIVRVIEGQVTICPINRLRSRDLVRETMLMAGEAAARFAINHSIPFPFATQEPPDPAVLPRSLSPQNEESAQRDQEAAEYPATQRNLAQYFAMRRALKRSQVSSLPAPHAGVGLPAYSRATSPLRRYLDLVAHQQLRAYLRGESSLSEQEMMERVGTSESIIGSVKQAEALSRRHWTLVYLAQNPDWQGEAVLVEKNDSRGRVIIPALALEAPVHLREDLPLDSRVTLALKGVNLPELEAHLTLL